MIEPRIASVATSLPPHVVTQADAVAAARTMFADLGERALDHLAGVFEHVEVDRRHVCVPLGWFLEEHPFAERNACYQRCALELATDAAGKALAAAGVDPADVGGLVFVSTTGLATPSLDARLLPALGLRPDAHRESIFGRGCAGGAVGLAQAADRVRLDERPVVLVVVELCSLTFRRRDVTPRNLVASALFGDGAAAVVLAPDGAGPTIVGRHGTTWPDTEDLMGWDFGDDGMTVVLSPRIPRLVRHELAPAVAAACARLGLDPASIGHHLVHPGSGRILDEVTAALGLDAGALDLSRAVLRDIGNASAATILFILERFLTSGRPTAGDIALVTALGPGFSAEHVVLRC